MSRRRRVIHKEEKTDARYGSPLVARLIGTIMKSGQRQLAERVVYEAIEESRQDPALVESRATGTTGRAALRSAGGPRAVAMGTASVTADPGVDPRTPRNAACPCGSGKKYKHCHGRV